MHLKDNPAGHPGPTDDRPSEDAADPRPIITASPARPDEIVDAAMAALERADFVYSFRGRVRRARYLRMVQAALVGVAHWEDDQGRRRRPPLWVSWRVLARLRRRDEREGR